MNITGKNYDPNKKVQLSGLCWNRCQNTNTMTRKNYDRKKRYSRLAYTICNTRNILFLLCLYLKEGKDLQESSHFLRKIECIEFECNAFVLVLVQIDLIHFEHINVLVQLHLKLIQIRYIQG